MKETKKNMKEYYVVKEGFISTTFLIVMCSMSLIIATKSDYITKANETYSNLREYEDLFYKEAQIIDYVKCALLRNEDLDDFSIDGSFVSIYGGGNEYTLCFDDYEMELEVYDKQIVGMTIEK